MELAVAEDRLEDVIEYAFSPAVVQVPLQAVLHNTAPNYNFRVACVVLNIKALKPNARKPVVRWGTKTAVVMYHRLVLCRDVSSGNNFYIMSEDATTSKLLFSLNRDVPYIGSYVVIYQPRSDGGTIYEVPIVIVRVPLVPATPQTDSVIVSPIRRDFVRKGTVESFFIEIPDLVIDEAEVVPACTSDVCDGRHTDSIMCPGLGSSSAVVLGWTFALRFSSAQHQLDQVSFRSTRLAQYFMKPALLKRDEVKHFRLKTSVQATLAAYDAVNASWLCHGFYKFQEFGEERETTGRTKMKLYISRLEPRGAASANVVLYDGVEAAPVLVDVPMLPGLARYYNALLAPLPAARQHPSPHPQQDPVEQQQHQVALQRQLNLQHLRQARQARSLVKQRKDLKKAKQRLALQLMQAKQ